MKNLTRILITIPLALSILTTQSYAYFNGEEGSRYAQFMEYDNGDGELWFNEYLAGVFQKSLENGADIDKKAFENAKNNFDIYDKDDNWVIDKRDKMLNGE